MKRNEFLKGVGLLGVGALVPFKETLAAEPANKGTSCVLIPTETEGPFPLDLTANSYYFRQDLREDRTGTTLNLKMKILGLNNCGPMQNVRVNIWACDKDGVYSGYDTPQNPGGVATTKWLRGYQMTDVNGEVNFVTVFPGWYSGRICHIHFQVYVSSVYKAVSQMTFPIDTKNALYAANPTQYTKGADPMTLAGDNIFNDGYAYQVATLTPNTSGGYDAYLEVTVNATGSTGLVNYEGETGGHFRMGQNYPNPHRGFTTIPVTLVTDSEVQVDLFDLSARRVAVIKKGKLVQGDYKIDVDCTALGIAPGNYIYQLQVSNNQGVFRQCKMMTAAQ